MKLTIEFFSNKARFSILNQADRIVSVKDYELCYIKDKNNLEAIFNEILAEKKIDIVAILLAFGGDIFSEPSKVDRFFLNKLYSLMPDYPLYIPSVCDVLSILLDILIDIEIVAFFQTSFFKNLLSQDMYYAIPRKISDKDNFKRNGFHGIYHEFNSSRSIENGKMISLVFDGQTTLSAVDRGRPRLVSLGYTPLEGIMGDRTSGDIDPGIIFYLMKKTGMNIFQIDELLKLKSGFKGLTGYDMSKRELLKFYGKDKNIDLAFDLYINQIIKYIGEAIAVLGGLDRIEISGSEAGYLIQVIRKILKEISFLGINLKPLPWDISSKSTVITSKISNIKVSMNNYFLSEIVSKKLNDLIKLG